MLNLDGLRQTDAGRRELAELLVEFGPSGKLSWSDEQSHARRRRAVAQAAT
jgi:hypothetical protein